MKTLLLFLLIAGSTIAFVACSNMNTTGNTATTNRLPSQSGMSGGGVGGGGGGPAGMPKQMP